MLLVFTVVFLFIIIIASQALILGNVLIIRNEEVSKRKIIIREIQHIIPC